MHALCVVYIEYVFLLTDLFVMLAEHLADSI